MNNLDGLDIFKKYFPMEIKFLGDYVSFSAKRDTPKKSIQLFADDFYVLSHAALKIAAEIKRQQALAWHKEEK